MIGRLATRFPGRVLLIAGLVFAGLGVLAAGAVDALSLNRYEAPGSESLAARSVLAERFDTGSPNVAVLVTAVDGTVDDADVAAAGRGLADRLSGHPGVRDVWSYWSADAPRTLASEDARHALVLAWVPGDADHVRGTVLPGIEADVVAPADGGPIAVQLGGGDEVFRVVAEQARTDFLQAELIILPLVALLLWAVYRRIAPALATLAIGVFSVVGTLGILRVVALFTEISTFASNIALVMGIGLGVDYGLFVTYRYREELAAGRTVETAVRRAVGVAGRTVVFSGVTVAASLAVLLVFPFPFLSSFAYAGIAVVLTAVAGAVVVLPAALRLLGHRAARRRPAASDGGVWLRTARLVMRRPVAGGGAAVLVLVLLGAPALGAEFGAPDDRVLPASQPVRGMYDTVRTGFATEDADAIRVVAPELAATDPALADYAERLSTLDGVARVDTAAGAFADGARVGESGPDGPARYTPADEGAGTWLAVLPTGERLAGDPTGLVAEVRALPAPGDALVGGYPAELADYRDGVVERIPLVGALIVVVTFVVLFLMTGSVIAPLKASVLNLLSLTVMFGVLVWGFQDGALAGPLGFTPTGVIEPSIPLLMFCIAYGLSMDYEVFLLARIKADYDRTGDVVGSVPRGIARSAPLVSAAALILAVSFAVYATSEVTFLQQLGIGMALAVLVDATIIRGVLLPAAMRLAGPLNWWAPAPLRRLHRRIGLREDTADPAPARPDTALAHR
ncbi:RND superfamily putative drug exporter [Spinactinospora alkalitolerans]|uniref:RND superfamily putative drug exporter n=1 Tax=Spinactinospora alkalitolerans TaxID=687207 RepID=A0A852TZA4_9ACTN|nr:MMPL family transporter [Spinactinospora alkalitolerans]NYE48113.1 RND superfamily putative drug exporter [Spinactinospora alkalitolerans]